MQSQLLKPMLMVGLAAAKPATDMDETQPIEVDENIIAAVTKALEEKERCNTDKSPPVTLAYSKSSEQRTKDRHSRKSRRKSGRG